MGYRLGKRAREVAAYGRQMLFVLPATPSTGSSHFKACSRTGICSCPALPGMFTYLQLGILVLGLVQPLAELVLEREVRLGKGEALRLGRQLG